MEINKLTSTVIIIFITSILVFLFVIPKYQEVGDVQNSLYEKEAEYNSKALYFSNIANLVAIIESKQDSLANIDAALPTDFSLAPLVFFFQKKGKENGLIVRSVTFSKISPPTAEHKIRNVTFRINIMGNYASLKNFLSSLDKSVRLFELSSISFRSPSASQDVATLENQQKIYDFVLELQTHTY